MSVYSLQRCFKQICGLFKKIPSDVINCDRPSMLKLLTKSSHENVMTTIIYRVKSHVPCLKYIYCTTSFRFVFKWSTFLNMPKQAFHANLDINGIEGIKRLQVIYDAVSRIYSNSTQEFVNLALKLKDTCRFTYSQLFFKESAYFF